MPLTQEQVRFEGHAIEVRLCAEDADHGFMPQSGTVALWQMPAQLRVEDALRSGAEIPPYYDSMIAKIISHGATRDEARRKLAAGLEDAVALGVTTNQAFLRSCLAHPVFAAGGATTAFIGQHQEALLAPDEAVQARAAALAAVLLYETSGERRQRGGGPAPVAQPADLAALRDRRQQAQNASVTLPRQRHFEVAIGERSFALDLSRSAPTRSASSAMACRSSATWFRDGAILLLQYRGRGAARSRTRPALPRRGRASRRRRQAARLDERPRGRGAGGRRRHGGGGAADRHAGGDEDGARACGAGGRQA